MGLRQRQRHAERFAGNAVIEVEHDPPVLGFFFQPEDVTLHDNWKVNALRGTGSQDISVTDLFVPHHHTFNPSAPPERGGALLRIAIPACSRWTRAFALGVARRALDEMAELAKTKSRRYIVPQGVAARGVFQYDLGRAENRAVRCAQPARGGERGGVGDGRGGRRVRSGRPDEAALRVGLRDRGRHRRLPDDVPLRGARSLYAGNVIERCMRDVVAGAQHGMVNDVAYEARGQIVLGVEGVAALN